MIEITRPFLPPLEEYVEMLRGVWERNRLTNDGPLLRRLEEELAGYLGIERLLLVANGTMALQIAYRALDLRGPVVTTPFTHISTTSSLVWEGCRPRFADIDPGSWNLSPAAVVDAVGPEVSGIVATHVYGNPCDVEGLEAVARRHDLRLVFDASHAFGTRVGDRSVLDFGDVSTLSFHATKLFHTVEGGAVVCRTPEAHERAFHLRNFGHAGPGRFKGVGINGKMSEIHAAMGLCNLTHADAVLAKRREDCRRYDEGLQGLPLQRPVLHPDAAWNGAYYAVLLPSEAVLLDVVARLEPAGIRPRRYFHPSLSELDYVPEGRVPVARDVASRVLCLPLAHGMGPEDIDRVCREMRTVLEENGAGVGG